MYPNLRVFDTVLKSASFELPNEGVAHPSPYVLIDTSAAQVDVSIDTNIFIYAAEMVFLKTQGANGINIVCPSGWTTSAGLDTDLLLPSSALFASGTWRVLIDGIRKLIVVLSASNGSGGSTSSFMLKFSGTLVLDVANPTTVYVQDEAASGDGVPVGYPAPHDLQFTDLYVNIRANTANQQTSFALRKNNVATPLDIPNVPAGTTGVQHIGSVTADFTPGDLIDLTADAVAGSGVVLFSAVAFGTLP